MSSSDDGANLLDMAVLQSMDDIFEPRQTGRLNARGKQLMDLPVELLWKIADEVLGAALKHCNEVMEPGIESIMLLQWGPLGPIPNITAEQFEFLRFHGMRKLLAARSPVVGLASVSRFWRQEVAARGSLVVDFSGYTGVLSQQTVLASIKQIIRDREMLWTSLGRAHRALVSWARAQR